MIVCYQKWKRDEVEKREMRWGTEKQQDIDDRAELQNAEVSTLADDHPASQQQAPSCLM